MDLNKKPESSSLLQPDLKLPPPRDSVRILSVGTFAMMTFFIGWLLAASFWDFNIVEFDYPESFTAVTSEQAERYNALTERHGPVDFVAYMANEEKPVFYWEDIVQFRVSYHKYHDSRVDIAVSLMPLDENGTLTQYVPRAGDANVGSAKAFLLTEQVRPGTIPGRYKMKINYTYRKPIGGQQTYTIETGEFLVKEKRPLPIPTESN